MKRVFFTLAIVFGYLCPVQAFPYVQQVDSEIRQVTVYQNGAQVTREASVQLSTGRNQILFNGLTNTLNPETIQLSGKGNFLILSLSHQFNYLKEQPESRELQRLTAKRDSLNNQIERKNTNEQVLNYELDILLSNKTLKGSQQNLSAMELEKAMDYFRRKLDSIESQKLEIKRELKILEEELRKVNQQISAFSNSRMNTTSEISAVIDSEVQQQVTLSLSYMVNNARWSPSYDVRVDDIHQAANLSYKANISQNTGIDWENVELTVSSAIPDQGGKLPELHPWYLNFYTPRNYEREADMDMELKSKRPEAAGQNQMAGSALQEVVVTTPVQFSQNQTSFSYKIDLPYSVPAGGKNSTVEITKHEIPADYRYYTSPKMRQQAYLTAQVNDWNQYNLLRGNANLFFDNTYVGKSMIDPQTISDTLSFSLGKDQSVIIERNKLKEFREKNFFGNRVRETFAWEITIRNTKDREINIEVEDQVPIPQNEDIEVNLNERSGAGYDRSTGKLLWKLNVDPNQNQKIRFEYEVEYPRGKKLLLE